MIPASVRFDQSRLSSKLDEDPLVQDYRAFFSLLDWSIVERWQASRSAYCGSHGHPLTAYLKTFLVRIKEGLRYTTDLRTFLLKHPLLVAELGFHLVLDPSKPYGIDAQETLPTRFWLGKQLRSLDRGLLTELLNGTISALQEEIPGLGEVVSIDVKHIYAWVRENNPRLSIPYRYSTERRPVGDPDCRVGVKTSHNRVQEDGSIKVKKEYLWGYGSGIVAATIADYGDVVLAERTLPFDQRDITFFRPLYLQVVSALGHYPTHLAADAAYDAWYVYEAATRHGGIAAVPLNAHTKTTFEPDGVPLCPKGLRMHPTFRYAHTNGYRAQRYRCPLLFPHETSQTCDHEQFKKGKGCQKEINDEAGGRARVLMDRTSPLYHAVYTQRTSCERINSQAKELGIERPRVHNMRSVANLNTLIYVVINVRALQRAKSINRGLLQIH
jgi:Transposase DDE domain